MSFFWHAQYLWSGGTISFVMMSHAMVMYFKALLACIPSTYVSDMLVKWTSIWYGLIIVIFETLKKI